MKERNFNEMIAYFNRRVSEMDIAQDYKIELLGMVAALGYKHNKTAQPTLYGYNIEHLELIARVLQKEDLPPERVTEALTDIGRIVAIVKDEFEETLRKTIVNYGLSKRYWSTNDCINGGGKAGA